jgi:hypothetical protein
VSSASEPYSSEIPLPQPSPCCRYPEKRGALTSGRHFRLPYLGRAACGGPRPSVLDSHAESSHTLSFPRAPRESTTSPLPPLSPANPRVIPIPKPPICQPMQQLKSTEPGSMAPAPNASPDPTRHPQPSSAPSPPPWLRFFKTPKSNTTHPTRSVTTVTAADQGAVPHP